jgi:hypothetical protein
MNERPREAFGVFEHYAMTRPPVQAAMTARAVMGKECAGENLNLSELIKTFLTQTQLARDGDLSRTECLLVSQAHTLDLLFNKLTRNAMNNMDAGYLSATETYMKLAFRAQSQCRAVAESLHEMKNPRPVYVGQANITNGPQQVNNGGKAEFRDQYVHGRAGAGEMQNAPNELLEETYGERLDFGTKAGAKAGDTDMEAVGSFDRTTVQSR